MATKKLDVSHLAYIVTF